MKRLLLLAVVLGLCSPARAGGTDSPEFRFPFDFAPGAEGGLAVLEDTEGVVRVSSGGAHTSTLPGLTSPKLLAADETGLLIVLDAGSTLVSYRRGRESWRVKLQGQVKPAKPVGMAARNGIVWLVDRAPARLFLYAYDGKGLGICDVKAWARSPFSVAVGPSGEAFVTDPMGPAVLVLTAAGAYSGSLDLAGTGVTRPTGVALDPSGRVWVSDAVTGIVALLDPKGVPQVVRRGGKAPRYQDPLRLGWSGGALWILEGRPGKVKRLEWEEP